MQGRSSILPHAFLLCLVLVLAESSPKTGRGVSSSSSSSKQKLQTLNTVLQQYAFRRVKSAKPDGAIVDVPELRRLRLRTDVKLQAAKLLAIDLQERGFVFNEFTIPKKSVSLSATGAVVLVYRRFAMNVNPYGFIGLSTNLSGPIIGLKVYNLSEDAAAEVPVSTTTSSHNVIQIKMDASAGEMFTCISFDSDGAIGIEGSIPCSKTCISNHLGDFSFLNPPESDFSPATAPSQSPSAASSFSSSSSFSAFLRKQKPWKLGIVLGSAALGALLIAVAAYVGVKALRGMRIARMERKAEKGEALQACLIGRSWAPAAASARTRPGLLEP